jgi:pyruvate dehydrogenase E1 component alpha subunit
MASLWKLPVIYVIENNQYGMGTSVARASSTTDLYRRGAGFDIPGRAVDGMNILTVYEAAKEAVAHCKSGKGPIILEMKTYRYRGHSMSDPAKYRTKEEVEKFQSEHDPIQVWKRNLLNEGVATEEDLKKIDKEAQKEAEDSAEFAKSSPYPEPETIFEDVYWEVDNKTEAGQTGRHFFND